MKKINISFTILDSIEVEDDANELDIENKVFAIKENIADALFMLPNTLVINDVEWGE